MTNILIETNTGINAGRGRAGLVGLFMCLMLVVSWSLTHHYSGLSRDAELYAVQALALLNPALNKDVYLAASSQDRYTLFSPIYAWTIHWFGLSQAGWSIFAACTVAFLASAWAIARQLWTENLAWLVVAALIVTVCPYGAYGVFRFSENYLTARSMAEALVVSSLAARFRGLTATSWLLAAVGLLIHPLMALPGLLLLLLVPLSWRLCFLSAATVAVLAISLALFSMLSPHASGPLAVMKGPWLEMVNERSQFLFLQNWDLSDWETHARILFSVGIAALSSQSSRARALCRAAAVVGVAGLLVGFIAGSLGPVAILLQGQAWRWFWVTGFVGVLTLIPTAARLWNLGGCGMMCAVLLIASWTLPRPYGTLSAAAALLIWILSNRLESISPKALTRSAYALVAAVLAAIAVNIWSICATPLAQSSGELSLLQKLQDTNALQVPALGIFCLGVLWTRSERFRYLRGASAAALATVCIFALPFSFKQVGAAGTEGDIALFAKWREMIPPSSSVLALPSRNSAASVWFSLQRPSYLTVNQSAGVVFSPDTAAEIRRRSDVLLPIMDPDWKLKTAISRKRRGEEIEDPNRPLTIDRLLAVCADPQLGFVLAKANLGVYALRNETPGEWKDWAVYDCSRVRASAGPV